MNRTVQALAAILLAACVADAAAANGCGPDTWVEDPAISPEVLRANGYRIVAGQTVPLEAGREAIEWVSVRGDRMAKCRTIHGRDGRVVETICFLRCRAR